MAEVVPWPNTNWYVPPVGEPVKVSVCTSSAELTVIVGMEMVSLVALPALLVTISGPPLVPV